VKNYIYDLKGWFAEKGKKNLVIWGAGKTGKACLNMLKKHSINVNFFVDKNKDIQGKNIMGMEIFSPEKLDSYSSPHDIFVFIASVNYTDIISDNLIKMGFTEKTDYIDYQLLCFLEKYFRNENKTEPSAIFGQNLTEAMKFYEDFILTNFHKSSKEMIITIWWGITWLENSVKDILLDVFDIKYMLFGNKMFDLISRRKLDITNVLNKEENRNIVFLLFPYYDFQYEREKKLLLAAGIDEKCIVNAKPLAEKLLKFREFSFSAGQADREVFSLFSSINKDISKLKYIDIGANHYLFYSNTYLFYLKGARGILVEANPDLCNDLHINRPGDIVINCGASAFENECTMKYYKTSRIGRNSFIKENITNAMSKFPDIKIIDEIEIPMRSINKILEEYFPDSHIDYLSIDVEGMDLEILEALNWESFCIDVILAELNPNIKTHSNFIEKMNSRGYDHKILSDSINLFYLRKIFGIKREVEF